ncbi:hypothetical protein ATPR_2885 [Acetobacter tropicalis NBRC 101654]|uniref:Uncharacterized protein n=1 Tax=Acetobacter tropicalis NBRC 101654 TaxID=749388 RepID=F7VHN6_9PROT|nr:hypothetical protein ATPR_2885 [Acetobacter tropicalis NBRC 101654]
MSRNPRKSFLRSRRKSALSGAHPMPPKGRRGYAHEPAESLCRIRIFGTFFCLFSSCFLKEAVKKAALTDFRHGFPVVSDLKTISAPGGQGWRGRYAFMLSVIVPMPRFNKDKSA